MYLTPSYLAKLEDASAGIIFNKVGLQGNQVLTSLLNEDGGSQQLETSFKGGGPNHDVSLVTFISRRINLPLSTPRHLSTGLVTLARNPFPNQVSRFELEKGTATSGYLLVNNDNFQVELSTTTGHGPDEVRRGEHPIDAGVKFILEDASDPNNDSSFTFENIGNYSNGSHEIFLGYKLDVADVIPQKKDSDGDGVPDEEDPCPDEKGTKENRGCPDNDGDSVIDKIDACPNSPGPEDNQGCPVLTYEQQAVVDTAFTNLEFEFGKAIITFDSYTHLDRLGVMLVNSPNMKLTIAGHTDNVGGDVNNMNLSEKRAKAVKSYLTARGITEASIIVLFYGENKPIAPNDTEEAREKNRRVELTIGFN